jgi:Immunoglobulin I-set domain
MSRRPTNTDLFRRFNRSPIQTFFLRSPSDLRDEFRSVPQDTDAVLGENIVLECSPPKGHPEPLVKWKKNGDNLDLTSAKRIKIDEAGNLVPIL